MSVGLDEVCAVLLAAGEGARLGGPKALLELEWRGARRPLLSAHAEVLAELGVRRVVGVVSASVHERLLGCRDPALPRLIVSREPVSDGPAGSLRAALGSGHLGAPWLALSPVDVHPLAHRALAELVAQIGAHDAATPVHGGRGGHPVLIRASVLASMSGASSLRDVLTALGPRRTKVFVSEPLVLTDFDLASEFADVFQRSPSFVGRPDDPNEP